LLLLLPMKQHLSQIRKPKSVNSSVAPDTELWNTVMILRKCERKPNPKTSSSVHDGMKSGFNVLFCLEP